MKIALGTTSAPKQKYLLEVLHEIGLDMDIVPVNVESGVSEQPKFDDVEKGSINRAKAAFEAIKDADFGLGIEVGYDKNKNGWNIFCCASVIDDSDFLESCISSKFPLPEFHNQILKNDQPLGDYVKAYELDTDEPVVNYVRELIRSRRPLIVEAVRNILLVYLNRL